MSQNEQIIRELYQRAEEQDTAGFMALFAPEGYFHDISAGQKYVGAEIGKTVDIYATAFPDMHRALEEVIVMGDVVVVQLSLNGTHNGPLVLPAGTIPATQQTIKTPCCDVFRLRDGKVMSFDCYTAATILFAQLGVLGNLSAALRP
ncbi:nuclear transport factor 2 family protein [Duganella aceris]|uniref:Nuclear transport factor 2 family protein n=1 Tax=Duganella aceris TaxID=2703883 RepID=A0ABX0FTW6_9BURK|nr:nuclear transport factor 2 family protein [Duganella aceris]NGZ88135.1 nuclear transport factor 2 family protein [Duganella aceris]